MFDFIRTHQRLMQLLLLIFVVPSFAFLGVAGYNVYSGDNADVAEVGKLSVTKNEFTQAQHNQLQQLQQSSQGRFDPALLENPQARRALLDQLIDQKLEIAVATREHFSVSDSILRQSIAMMPNVQENGQFSAERYRQMLASYGMSAQDFEQSQRAGLALEQVLGPVQATAWLPTPVLDSIKRILTEKRTAQLRIFPASEHADGITLSDEDIKAWYDAHQDALRLPDQVAADYLILDEAAAVASVPAVADSRLKEYYEQNKARYVTPARVELSHILIKVPAKADEQQIDAARQQAKQLSEQARSAPDEFAQLARERSQDAGSAREGGSLGWIQPGTLPAAMDQVVFALKAGEVSDPVRSTDGFHVFKAVAVQPEAGKTFEQARDEVEGEVRRQLAADRFADMASELTSLVYDDSDSLQPAANKLGLTLRHATGIARERLLTADEAGEGAAASSPDAQVLDDVRVRQALFSSSVLTDHQNSGVIEISPDTMVVVRVASETPAHVPELAQVHEQIASHLRAERAVAAATDEGRKVLETLQKGETIEGRKATAEGFEPAMTFSRLDPAGLNKSVLDAAFELDAEKLPAFGGIELPTAYVIVQLEKVEPGVTDDPALEGLGDQLAQTWGASERQAVLADLRTRLGVKLTDAGRTLIEDGDSGR